MSDHPVTVYNRACFPGSEWCRGFNDPDIRMVGTHTYFPLSIEKILILTNLAWVRNPYQSERKLHPNPGLFRNTIFKFTDVQTYRNLSEQEVLEINYMTKRRALLYVAGAEREWLFPERYLPFTHWNRFGQDLLLMPEPREIHMGGEVMVSHKCGGVDAWNEYGHREIGQFFRPEWPPSKRAKKTFRFAARNRRGRTQRRLSLPISKVGRSEILSLGESSGLALMRLQEPSTNILTLSRCP
jgi:hypothetical protein